MKKELIFCILSIILLFGCQSKYAKDEVSSKGVNYFDSMLKNEKYNLNFECDTEMGFIKIGNFLKKRYKTLL